VSEVITLHQTPSPRAGGDDRIICHNPATRQRLGEVRVDSPEAVREAIVRARRAQVLLGESTFAQRRELLGELLDYVTDQAHAICELVVKDSGKTHQHALMGEIWPVAARLRWTMSEGEKHLRPERVSSGLLMHKRARHEFHPRGVIGAILPWNYPFQNLMNPIIPALMAGNAVVLKPSEWVAHSSAAFIEEIRGAIARAGFNPDLVQVVQGYAETGRALIAGGIDQLVFIGSVENGRRVLETAAEPLVPVVLELGGKDPFIVCDDADVEQAAHAALSGCFINCGQNCVASERLLVHGGVYARFDARVRELTLPLVQGASRAGEAVDVGAMITPIQLERVEELVQRAIDEGARVVAGAHRVHTGQGDFYAPTILADVTPDMTIMREETFGPVMLLCRVDSDEEAIRVANATEFGLSSSVFSRDRSRARRIASRVQAGMVGINDYGGMTYMAQDLTFGGVKASGYGRMNGRDGLRALCNQKAVLDDRLPLSFPTRVFPVRATDYARAQAAVELLYGRGISRRR